MPLTKTGKKVKAAMVKQYGVKKGEEVFYATMNKYGKQWHQSPDSYNDSALGEQPPRSAYKGTPENVTTAQTPQKAGSARGSIQQSEGTASPRAEQRTRSAALPGEKAGGSKISGAVDSYGEGSGETP